MMFDASSPIKFNVTCLPLFATPIVKPIFVRTKESVLEPKLRKSMRENSLMFLCAIIVIVCHYVISI